MADKKRITAGSFCRWQLSSGIQKVNPVAGWHSREDGVCHLWHQSFIFGRGDGGREGRGPSRELHAQKQQKSHYILFIAFQQKLKRSTISLGTSMYNRMLEKTVGNVLECSGAVCWGVAVGWYLEEAVEWDEAAVGRGKDGWKRHDRERDRQKKTADIGCPRKSLKPSHRCRSWLLHG